MLEEERHYFDEHHDEWLKQHPGEFVLIKGDKLIGVFSNQADALSEGARCFGTDSFLVRQVEESEQLVYIPALTLGILRANSIQPA